MKKESFASTPTGISTASMAVNLLLSLLKLAAGIFGHAQALVADAVHSASDVLTTVVVLISICISKKSADADHQYGHQKFESIAALFLSAALAFVGIEIGIAGVKSIVSGSYENEALPGLIAIIAAAVSIVTKEIMFRMTMKVAEKNKSTALKADAWHHRSDALSSIGSLAGVAAARCGFPIMDPIASLVICFFILKTAADLFLDAVKQLTDSSCGEEIENRMRGETLKVDGVQGVDMIKTRLFGAGYYVDMEISVDGALPLRKAHSIAESVHDKIEKDFPDVYHCMVHVNPAEAE